MGLIIIFVAGLSFTLVLSSVAFKFMVAQDLPRVNYMTLCDVYSLANFVFLAFVVFQTLVLGILCATQPNELRSSAGDCPATGDIGGLDAFDRESQKVLGTGFAVLNTVMVLRALFAFAHEQKKAKRLREGYWQQK